MSIPDTISLLGGLAFFLFGMTLLGEGLKRMAGGKLEMILAKLTSTTFRGVLLGTLVTAIIQSSSATTVMVVGFVNSGIMQLRNAIGVIMGANIGTTATGWILVLAGVEEGGLSSATMFSFVAFVGIILYFFCKKPTQKNLGMVMLAFSVLMSGMQSMSGAMAPLKHSPAFLHFISAVSNPLVAILVGIAVTAVIQSCSASIGILQALSVTGVISYEVALPMTIGMCIGACAPVLLSAIGAKVNGKRAAFVYLLFNLSGAALLLIPFYLIHGLVGLHFMSDTATSMGIAILNTVFKVCATLLLIPFAGLLQRAVTLLFPDKPDEDDDLGQEVLLDERLVAHPALALEQAERALLQMSAAAFKNLQRATELFTRFSPEKFNKIISREERVDRFEDRLGAYLVRLHTQPLTDNETQTSAKYLTCLSNVERISDHAVNLAELAQELADKKVTFSPQAMQELTVCMDAIREIIQLTEAAMTRNDLVCARTVEPLEETVDQLSKVLKDNHIQRLQAGQCTLALGFIYNDAINNFERISDHCSNIAVAVLEANDAHLLPHAYLHALEETGETGYRSQLAFYQDKYLSQFSAIEV